MVANRLQEHDEEEEEEEDQEVRKCVRDVGYFRLQKAYCQFLSHSFAFALAAIAEIVPRRKHDARKTIVMDFDAVFASEDECTNYEMFSCAVNFVKEIKEIYGTTVSIVVITARQTIKELRNDLWTVGLTCGPSPDSHIANIMFDTTRIGTAGSKLRNRNILRNHGATIIASIGDNVTDMVSDLETDMYADTLNILLPNIYRHVSLSS